MIPSIKKWLNHLAPALLILSFALFARAPHGHFDLILMDVQMPVMDGLEASRRIRSGLYPGGETIPIIGLSANAFEQDVQQAMESGMSAYLPKPFHVHQLDEVMQKLF